MPATKKATSTRKKTAAKPTSASTRKKRGAKRPGKALVKRSTSDFEEVIGGRDNLTGILSTQPRDAKQDILFRLLSDPARAGDSLATICADANVSATEIFSLYRTAIAGEAMVKAQVALSERLDGVVKDVAEKAADHVKDCECVILSEIGQANPRCKICAGKGEIYKEGSLKHAEVVLKATDVLKQGGGVNVAVNQNLGVNVGGGLLDSFVKATDEAAFDIIDAEKVEPETDQ